MIECTPEIIYATPIKNGSASGKWYKKGEGPENGVVYIRMDIAGKKTKAVVDAVLEGMPSNYT